MFQPALDPQAVHDLQAILSGTLITRNDEDYDTARKVWNGMIDKYPALIVRCMDATDEVLHTLTEETLATMSPETIVQIRVLGGAMGRVSVDATAFAHRATQAMVIITNFGPPSANAKGRSARTEQVWQALQPYAKGVYVNFLAEEGEQRIHEAYPPTTYARLAALKNLYDPTNFFHMNQNIKPFTKEACEVPQDRFSRSA